MRFDRFVTTTCLLVLLTSVDAWGARPTREEMELNFQYGWSESASMIFYGTVAAVEFHDDPKEISARVDVLVRVDSVQRGVPGNSMVRVRLDDELQTYYWRGDRSRVGENGLWFVHRVRQYDGAPPRSYLIRYMDRTEIESDPQFIAELMKFVVQDTVDQAIRPNILNLLEGNDSGADEAKVLIDLEYDDAGMLSSVQFAERSGNLLFNDHVYDTVLQIHRRIRIPGQVKKTQIAISREVL